MPDHVPPSTTTLITLPDVASILGAPIIRVHQLLKDGQLVAATDGTGRRVMPAGFVTSDGVVKALPAVIRLLRDAKYSDEEIVDWLSREDDTLPGTPLQALIENRGTEIKRRAQASGL
jgi:hypothetical protein